MTKVMDCDLQVSKFKLQECYHFHFQIITLEKGLNPLIPQAIGRIVSILFFYKDSFDIEWLMNVDMLLNKETKPTKLHLMVRLQSWSFGECWVSLHHHYS